MRRGWFLTYQTPFTLLSRSLPHPPTSTHFLVVAYFNDDDEFYSAWVAPEEFDSYLFLQCQTLVTTDGIYRQETPTFAGSWATVDRCWRIFPLRWRLTRSQSSCTLRIVYFPVLPGAVCAAKCFTTPVLPATGRRHLYGFVVDPMLVYARPSSPRV